MSIKAINQSAEAQVKKTNLMFKTMAPMAVALFLIICSVVYLSAKMISNKAYYEKWKDYDECGRC